MWITGVSRNLSHELVRHHVGFSPSQRSTRYVDERDSAVVDHPVRPRRAPRPATSRTA
jgi:thymidylate synthase ThyX